MHSDRVERPKVSPDTANFILEDFMIESSLELSLPRTRRRDVPRFLTAAKDNKILLWRDGSCVQRSIGDICFEDLQGVCINDLGCFVLGRGDKVRPVLRELEIGDRSVVRIR